MPQTLTVGAGEMYKTIAGAVAASHAGDTIDVDAGTYTAGDLRITHDLTIQAVGGPVDVVAPSTMVAGGNVAKGIFIVGAESSAPNVTIEGLSFSGAISSASNGSGIRYQSGNMTLLNDTFVNNQDGVLGNPFAENTGTIIVQGTTFNHNGAGDGQSHNIYIGEIAQFTMENSVSEHANVGHEVKSRAFNNTIENNLIFDGNGSAQFPGHGTASYDIDLPNGGNDIVQGNTIEKGPNSQATIAIHFGGPSLLDPNSNLIVSGNTLINNGAYYNVMVSNQSMVPVTVSNNLVQGFSTANILQGVGSESGNVRVTGVAMPNQVNADYGDPANTVDYRGTSTPQTLAMKTAYQTVEGGDGLLTVKTGQPFENVIGGAGGINLTANWGPLAVYTAAGSTNTLMFNHMANALFDQGTDTVTIACDTGSNPYINVTGNATINELAGVTDLDYWVGGNLTLNTATCGSQVFDVRPGGTITVNGPAGYAGVETDGTFTHNAPKFGYTISGGAAGFSTGGSVNINTYDMNHGADEATISLVSGSYAISTGGGATVHAGGAAHVSLTNYADSLTFIGGSGSAWVGNGTGAAHIIAGTGTLTTGGAQAAAGAIYEVDAAVGGGTMTITDFRSGTDQLLLNGFVGNPIVSQVYSGGALHLGLANHTNVVLTGVHQL